MEFAAEMSVEREGRSNTSENNTADVAGNPAIAFYDTATIQVALPPPCTVPLLVLRSICGTFNFAHQFLIPENIQP